MKTLFPPRLDKGSSGLAVDVLHTFLCAMGYGRDIVRDSEYGDETAAAVQKLQGDLGVEQDGNFGPQTREALKAQRDLDVDAIFLADGDFETTWIGEGAEEGGSVWGWEEDEDEVDDDTPDGD